jgi:hypothetical protein
MADNIYTRLRSYLNPAIKGKFASAMLYALAAGDGINEANVVAVKSQLFVATATSIFLDKLIAGLGFIRPPGIGISDDLFRELTIKITNSKLVTNIFLDVLETFYGMDAVRANVLAGSAQGYVLADGMTLLIQVDADPLPLTITFQAQDFTNIAQATAEEVSNVISSQAFSAGYSITAAPLLDITTGQTSVQLMSGTKGPRSSITIVGGAAQNILNFPQRSQSAPQLGTQFSTSFVGDAVRFTWIAGPNPALGFINPGDYVNIFGPQFLSTNQGVFTVTAVQDGAVGFAYFDIINPNFQVQGAATLNAVGGTSGQGTVIASAVPTSAVRISGITTIDTLSPHGFTIGQQVTVRGIDNSTFNGVYQILTTPTTTSFTYAQLGADAASSGGGAMTVSYNVVSINGAVRITGTSTITTTTPHDLQVGQIVQIENVLDSSFDGMVTITSVTSNTFTYTQNASNDLVFFTAVKQTIQKQLRYASVYEVNPYEIVIFLPATTKIVTRQLQGSWHVHDSGVTKSFLGSYTFDPHAGFPISQNHTTLTQDINEGSFETVGFGFNTESFPDSEGFLVFDYGTSNQEGPVKYLGRPSSGSLLLDPAYKFKKTHVTGSSVNLLAGRAPYKPKTDGSDYPTYVTGTIKGRIEAQALIESLTASGIFLNIVIVYPKGPGLQDIEGYVYAGDQL